MDKKTDFSILTDIHVIDDKTVNYDTRTDIGFNEPKNQKDKPEFFDPNDLLYYYWSNGIAAACGLNAKEAEILVNELCQTIYDTQAKIVTVDAINEKYDLPPLPSYEAVEQSKKPSVGNHILNVRFHVDEEKNTVHYEVETDIIKDQEDPKERIVLFYYWAHAISECVTLVRNKALREYLAKLLFKVLLTHEMKDKITASIND